MAGPERRVARVAASAALVFTVVSLAAEAVLQPAVVDVADGDVLLLTVLVASIVNGLVLVRTVHPSSTSVFLLGEGTR